MKSSTTKRFLQIDYIKGLCILLVVVSHTIHFPKEYPYLSLWMQVVFLRGFFFSTGWLYANKDKTTSIINKGKKFIIQYAVLSAAMIIIQQIISMFVGAKETYIPTEGFELFKNNVLNTISFNGIGTLWFLPIMFITSICAICLIKIKNEKIQYVLAFIIMIIGLIAHSVIGHIEFNNALVIREIVFVKRLLMAISFAMVGFLAGKLNRIIRIKNYVWLLLTLVFLVTGTMAYYVEWNEIYFVLYVLSLYSFMSFLASIRITKKVFYFLEWLGQNSLYIMVIHYFICVPIFVEIFMRNGLDMKSAWIRIILWAIVVATSVLITLIIKKSKAVRFVFEQK